MRQLAEGELSIEIPALATRDEIGAMAQTLEVFSRNAVEKNRLDHELQEYQRSLTALMGNLPGMAYRARNDRNWTMEFISEGCMTLTGFQAADLLHNNTCSYTDLIHPDDREPVWERVQLMLKEHKPFVLEYRIQTASGEEKWVWEKGTGIFSAGGDVLALEGFMTDITGRKRAENQLQAYSEQLEEMVTERTQELQEVHEQLLHQERTALIGRLVGAMGHELRNPLTTISNAVYYLKMIMPDPEEAVKEYLEIVDGETRNAEKIISDLLDFARIKSFRRHIEQVLLNLVTNACEAMPDGGTLSISSWHLAVGNSSSAVNTFDLKSSVRAERVEAPDKPFDKPFDTLRANGAIPEVPAVLLTVHDTGCGMSPEQLKKIFEPLFSTKTKGIGLGLAISQNLIEANGGRLAVQSEPGEGSTFTLLLPMEDESSALIN